MNITDLPVGNAPEPVAYPHFPTRYQVFIWRNWGMIPAEKMAEILSCTETQVLESAQLMGLNTAVKPLVKWRTHGYLTLLRNNWHLLDYAQILKMLEWSPEKLAYTLKEEDFFFVKVGRLKPACPKLTYRELTQEELLATEKIREIRNRYFPEDISGYAEQPFSFADAYAPCPVAGKDKFAFNYIHSYAASCGDIFLNAEELDPVPENLLAQYASMGIKGVWMHAIMYLFEPIPGAEEFSAGYEKRFANLKKVAAKCEKYGLKLYLYLNEPRTMPASFYEKKPEWRGAIQRGAYANCITRTEEPLKWLEKACRHLFAEAPGLGGVYIIAMSENTTHCNSGGKKENCPYCKDVPDEMFLVKIAEAIERGIHSAAPEANVIFSDWAWTAGDDREAGFRFKKKVLDKMPKGICYATISEWGKETHAGGISGNVVDYSISQVGPAEESARTLAYAKSIGLKTVAKVQINNSWELSAVPYIPVPYLLQEHLENLRKLKVDGLMLSWTLGGFPGGNLELLRREPEEIARTEFHPAVAEKVCEAWKIFSDAFREFPFHVGTLYNAPMNYGPMNLYHLEKTHYHATMIGFPYDDLECWRSIYPEEIFENQFRILTDTWKKGLELLKSLSPEILPEEKRNYEELCTIAEAAYCHLRSTWCQIRFVRARNSSMEKEVMAQAVREDMLLTLTLHEIVRRDSRIGFEASNHYYYTLNDLKEKILNCEDILARLQEGGDHGRAAAV